MTKIKIYYADRPPEEVKDLEVENLTVTGGSGLGGLNIANGVLQGVLSVQGVQGGHIVLKYGTKDDWEYENPVLYAGELGYEKIGRSHV